MNIKHILGIVFWISILFVGCNRDDISFESPSSLLRFSTDTLFCDTVYNQMRSETYAVKVYNREDKDVRIPRIYLEGGSSSQYRINVDGKPGTSFENVALRKNDSLFVFVEIAPVANAPEAIVEDKVVFETPAGQQKVSLFSVVQDAEYFIQTGDNPLTINENSTWTNNKAKVIFGKVNIAEGKSLTIEKGTKVYFRKNSELTFEKNSSLVVNGAVNEEVIFRGDRSDTRYDTLPANWKGIKMEENSLLNMKHAKVYGGIVGLQLEKNTAVIENSIFHTFQSVGIYGINTNLTANNVVINNCGESSLAISAGGNYNFNYCTITNYWSLNPSMPALGVYASNVLQSENGIEAGDLLMNVKNSIIYGDLPDMISINKVDGVLSDIRFDNSLLKLSNNAGFTPIGSNIIRNENPLFENYFTHKMNMRVKANSPARKKGAAIPGLNSDIVGVIRSNPSTLGAYE